MNDLRIDFDTTGLSRIDAAMRQGANRTPDAIRRAINWAGDRARTQVRRELTEQTGLPYKTIKNATVTKHANFASLDYRIRARGGNVRLKFFKPRETSKGVSAAPWGKRRVFANTFMKGGRFPDRVDLKMGGEVFERVGNGHGTPRMKRARSGLFIPTELTRGNSATAFGATVQALLPGRVEHEVAVVLGGMVR